LRHRFAYSVAAVSIIAQSHAHELRVLTDGTLPLANAGNGSASQFNHAQLATSGRGVMLTSVDAIKLQLRVDVSLLCLLVNGHVDRLRGHVGGY
jgi:hypothetical protein